MVGKIRNRRLKSRLTANLFACLALLIFTSTAFAEKLTESYRIYIENKADGRIMVSMDQGKNWTGVGKVLVPVSHTNKNGYTASEWVDSAEVAACAVNAIHIKTNASREIFSILPKTFLKRPSSYNSYLNKSASLYTGLEPNQSIFGGDYAPVVGSKVLINSKKLKPGYVPKINDSFTLIVERPKKYPQAIVFENIYKGEVKLQYKDGREKTVAYVLRPVAGVGRFAGTRYIDSGRIRANHAGVIDISTSVKGRVGGFQIIPASHAQSKEMRVAKYKNQWMVVGPVVLASRPLEGVAPLFKYYLKPQYNENDLLSDNWESKLLEHFLVEAKIKGKWQPLPVYSLYLGEDLPQEANYYLKNIDEFRILFPREL